LSFHNVKFYNLIIAYTPKIFFGVVLCDRCLMDKYILLVVISADESVAVPYIEPLDCALDFLCYYFATSFITWGFFLFRLFCFWFELILSMFCICGR